MSSESVSLRGRSNMLELILSSDVPYPILKDTILQKLNKSKTFFYGTSCIKIIGKLSTDEQKDISDTLKKNFAVISVDFCDEQLAAPSVQLKVESPKAQRSNSNAFDFSFQAQTAEILSQNLPLYHDRRHKGGAIPSPSIARRAPRPRTQEGTLAIIGDINTLSLSTVEASINSSQSMTLFVHETVRSGQRVSYDGDIVVLGDVNVGAEIVATGSIIIMGILRATAHAGAQGNEAATITALRLKPTQLRIGRYIAIAPDSDINEPAFSEVAKVMNGAIIIRPLSWSKSI